MDVLYGFEPKKMLRGMICWECLYGVAVKQRVNVLERLSGTCCLVLWDCFMILIGALVNTISCLSGITGGVFCVHASGHVQHEGPQVLEAQEHASASTVFGP
jgi:hypothetical protein